MNLPAPVTARLTTLRRMVSQAARALVPRVTRRQGSHTALTITWRWRKPRPLRIGYIQASNETDLQLYRPLAFGYLKAYTETYLDHPIEMRSLDTLDDLADLDIIGISATSQGFAPALDIARLIKNKNRDIMVILGGHHITHLPETLPLDCDLGVRGEGEQTFLELLDYFTHNGLRLKPDDLHRIKGIVFRHNGRIVTTEPRDPIANLDILPFPFREKGHDPYLFTSRGCPYRCAYCACSAFWRTARFFSADYVVREIEWILACFPGRDYIPIWDDLFIAHKPRFKRIIDLMEERKIPERVRFSLALRANLVDDELARDLKRMNAFQVGFGAESASDRILRLLHKGTTTEMNQRAIDILHRHGFQVKCSFIVGSPTETEDDVHTTYRFILRNIAEGKLSPDDVYVNILMPLPRTAMWEYAIRAGLVNVQSMDWHRVYWYASYKNSTIKDFNAWVEARRRHNPIYMAEDTLPQERLFELMSTYEQAIQALAPKPHKQDPASTP